MKITPWNILVYVAMVGLLFSYGLQSYYKQQHAQHSSHGATDEHHGQTGHDHDHEHDGKHDSDADHKPEKQEKPEPASQDRSDTTPPSPETPTAAAVAPRVDGTKVHNVAVFDQRENRVIFRGTIELKPTLDRINRNEPLTQFRHDGTVFQNREKRLPQKPNGHYREWVHPTPKISGPGPQRVISGKQGERYYTFNHYQSFLKIEVR